MRKLLIIAILCAGFLLGPSLSEENAKIIDLSRTELVERNYKVQKTIKEEKCLTEAIYYEAGNQSEIGKEAVALVILNRVGQKHRPKTICGVIAQAHIIEDKKVCQFSFWCATKYKPNKEKWAESQKISHRVLQNFWNRVIMSQYGLAVYYHADYVKPKWRKTKLFLGKIDKHLFYGEPPHAER
jgi:spore germination cell wall hydrolase CwlJ-like protein